MASAAVWLAIDWSAVRSIAGRDAVGMMILIMGI